MTPPPDHKTGQPKSRERLKVLVMDDDSFQLDLIAELLRGLGFSDIQCVTSGNEVMRSLSTRSLQYDLILTDLHMPGMDGFEFMDLLAQAGYLGALIIVSGQSEEVMRGATLVAKLRRFTLLGALPKPVERAALARLVDRMH